jgi:ADP-ribose pyrophosphatase YjhB (NUDIX family)
MSRTRATSVVVKGGKLLMIRRFNNGEEYWVLPGGGVEEGEGLERAVLRELEEETSIRAELKDKLLEFIDSRGDKHSLFLCEYVSGEPRLHADSEEANNRDANQSYNPEWVEVSKLPELTIYPTEEKEFLIQYFK